MDVHAISPATPTSPCQNTSVHIGDAPSQGAALPSQSAGAPPPSAVLQAVRRPAAWLSRAAQQVEKRLKQKTRIYQHDLRYLRSALTTAGSGQAKITDKLTYLYVRYFDQGDGNGCWFATFHMKGTFHGRTQPIDYSDDAAAYEHDDFKPLTYDALVRMAAREGLRPIEGCNDPERNFSIAELDAMLQESGPIAFAWRNTNVAWIRDNPRRYHWSLIVGLNKEKNEIIFHNPIRSAGPNRKLSIDKFNEYRVRWHDHTMLR